MTAISYRLLIIGPDEEKPVVLPVWSSDDEVWWFPGNYSSEFITNKKNIGQLTTGDFPQWLTEQNLPMILSPVRIVEGETEEEAGRKMFEAIQADSAGLLKAA